MSLAAGVSPATGASLAIEAVGLGRDYGDVRALEGLDLAVSRGSVVGLLGPNGAGKTTPMLLLATLLSPSRGSARIFGHDVLAERRLVRRRLGLVFQETSVDGLLTVEENLLFAARLAGLRGRLARAAVADAIERGGLGSRARQPARELSGGWRRLVDVVRATLHQPDLLILDEPTVGLDPEHRDAVWALLDTQRRAHGTAVLFSTHYLAEAEPADRVVLLAQGRVVADEAPDALRTELGDGIAEIEGPGAERLARAIRGLGAARAVLRTGRGVRVGLRGDRESVVELAGGAPGIERFTLRPTTLEDVYFARTQRPAESDGEEPL
ncbi:MAG TPA: ABC transporter ATP-binding protein [Gemmatimonadales bacterium]|nr:ABC transporter ATP-binding protein [Gemmatimonadales bacterium]